MFWAECLPRHQSTFQLYLICFPCLEHFVFVFFHVVGFEHPDILLGKTFLLMVNNAYGIFALFITFLASSSV